MSEIIKVSVIIPIYNSEQYLRKCLDSIVIQSIKKMEILCVEDGSSDASRRILDEYSQKYNHLKVISYGKNMGQAYARNKGLEEAKGRYIYFADSDDELLSADALEILYEQAVTDDLDAVMFDADIVYESEKINVQSSSLLKMKHEYKGVYDGESYVLSLLEHEEFKPAVWMQFWKKEYLRTHQLLFRTDTSPHEDILFSFQAMLLGRRIRHIDQSLYCYLYRDTSSSRGVNKKRYQAYALCYFYLLEFCKEHPFRKELLLALFTYMKSIRNYLKQKSVELLKNGFDVQEIEFEQPFHQVLLKMILTEECSLLNRVFGLEEYRKLAGSSKIIVYGTGIVGQDVMHLLERYGFFDYILAVTDIKNSKSTCCGKKVYQLDQIQQVQHCKGECTVLVAVTKKYQEQMIQKLYEAGFENYICLI